MDVVDEMDAYEHIAADSRSGATLGASSPRKRRGTEPWGELWPTFSEFAAEGRICSQERPCCRQGVTCIVVGGCLTVSIQPSRQLLRSAEPDPAEGDPAQSACAECFEAQPGRFRVKGPQARGGVDEQDGPNP
jgi:hypothetical protein